ncbi:MAG: hypothetical protein JOY82_18130 [Streptosporangiaceae bacterium]|nr:hypothetical protein [Streptosporangiaceae bacterium]MBV9856405.1 hypothetical protein [Streptosporangiaceae bacterium]
MGKKHRNPWGGPPIDDLALTKHRNRDGSKLTVAQIASAWLRPIYAFPQQPGDRPSWRFVACWDEHDEPLEIGVENYGVRGRQVIKHAMPLIDRITPGSLVDKLDAAMPGWDARNPNWRDPTWRPQRRQR